MRTGKVQPWDRIKATVHDWCWISGVYSFFASLSWKTIDPWIAGKSSQPFSLESWITSRPFQEGLESLIPAQKVNFGPQPHYLTSQPSDSLHTTSQLINNIIPHHITAHRIIPTKKRRKNNHQSSKGTAQKNTCFGQRTWDLSELFRIWRIMEPIQIFTSKACNYTNVCINSALLNLWWSLDWKGSTSAFEARLSWPNLHRLCPHCWSSR